MEFKDLIKKGAVVRVQGAEKNALSLLVLVIP